VIIAVRQLVIRPEEHYLAQRFGQACSDTSRLPRKSNVRPDRSKPG
jgi:hypothetical protein